MTTFTELFELLAPDANIRGKQFERICKWYLEHDPFYASQLARVWLWKDWPGRWYPRREAGIDLVAEHRDGTLWAIQAKAYDSAYSVTKGDVDKFLSESNRKDDTTGRPVFSYRLLLATTRKQLGSTARNTVNAQVIPVGYRGRTELDAVEIDWPASPSDLRARRLPPKKPEGQWAYQGEAMNKVVSGFRQADRGKLIMACGTGKTLTALFIREKLAASRTLVLMPSLQLMKQTIGEWTRNKTVDFDFLPVCSDETVSKDDVDMPVSSTSDLGLPVTTDPEEIAAFLRRRSGPLVVFSTYQSSPQIAEAFKLSRVPAFDLAIADEAHRCAAAHSSEFATILDDEKIKARRRLFMTATPRIYLAHVLKTAKEAGYEFASMDDEEKFGKVFHRLTFREAIQRNLLTDYQVAIIGVDNATYRGWAEKARLITIDGKVVKDARSVAGQIGLATAMRRYDLHRVITFHRLVKGAKEFKASFPEVIDWMPTRQRPKGKLWTDYVDGTMSAGERQRRLQCLGDVSDGAHAVISNARCLTEGVDVPTLDGVAFIDPKRSEIDIAQAVGRAIRLADDKTIGTIVIPVFIDTDEPNPDVVLDDSAFKPVWDVLLALRAHDEDLAQQFDELRRQLGRRHGSRGPVNMPPNLDVDLGDQVGEEFVRAFNTKLVEMTTASWEFWYGLLESYAERESHTRVPDNHVEDGYKLGKWVQWQRTSYTKSKPGADRIRRLEQLPGWTWDPLTAQWEEAFGYLLRYAEREGHTRVEPRHVEDGYGLGRWVSVQRIFYGRGKLAADRIRRLEELPGWTWDPRTDWWEQGFSRLQEYVERHGDARVPSSYTVQGYRLGGWVQQQCTTFTEGNLAADRQQRLEKLTGWTWDTRAADWENGYHRLLDYVEHHGDARVPPSYTVEGYRLGRWVQKQRTRHTEGTLNADRQHRLEKLPGWAWDPRTDMWGEGYRWLVEYVERHGDARVPGSYTVEGYRLGKWVIKQRQRQNEGTLDAERQRRLEKLPGWTWNTLTDQWEEGFGYLLRYAERETHTRVPDNHVEDGYRLGQWVGVQRTFHGKGKLGADRIRRLAELPGWTWNLIADQWEEAFGYLVRYAEREGHTRVLKDHVEHGYRLGQWVANQRAFYGRGKLAADRIRRLEELSGWTWDPRTADWENGYRRLRDYAEREGHARMPFDHVEDGYRLGSWVNTQRTNYGKGKLGADRIRRLAELPGWTWNLIADQWEEAFGYLVRYAEREGYTRVLKDHVEHGYRLGQWVGAQRNRYGQGKLEAERILRLEELPGWTWNTHADQWEEGFGHLVRYAEREGCTRVPASHVEDGYRLGKWVVKQRTTYGSAKLDADRIRRLEELPGWTWHSRAAQWQEGFGYLVRYAERQGHTRVPVKHVEDGYRLGGWVNQQRYNYGKGKLEPDCIRRLEELPGWAWDARPST